MIEVGDRYWRYLSEPIYVNGKRVYEVYENGTKVYPESGGVAYLVPGPQANIGMGLSIGDDYPTSYNARSFGGIHSIAYMEEAIRYGRRNWTLISTNDSPMPVYGGYDEMCTDADIIFLNEDSSFLFSLYSSDEHYNRMKMHAYGYVNDSEMYRLDCSLVKNAKHMFSGRRKINLEPLRYWNVSNIENMSHMFESSYDSNEDTIDFSPISGWDTSNVKDMSFMFYESGTDTLGFLSGWDVGSVTDMSSMFFRLGIHTYNLSYKIIDLSPLSNWNVSSLRNMNKMFYWTHIATLEPLSNWNVSSVVNMSEVFNMNKPELTAISNLRGLENWNVANVLTFERFFNLNAMDTHIDAGMLVNWPIYPWANFERMFTRSPISSGVWRPRFTYPGWPGEWNSFGTFTFMAPEEEP